MTSRMIDEFLSLFKSATPPDRLDADDADVALAALLVRLAKSDGDMSLVERDKILAILGANDAKNPEDMLAEAEALEAVAPDNVRFTRVLKDAVPYETRSDLIEALWAVALADGVREAEEDGFLRLVAGLLGVNDRDSALARQRVQASQS